MNQPITSQKLTKKFFLSLEQGLFVVSNVCHAPGIPVYVDVMASADKRGQQWLEIKGASANGRLCKVFRSKEHYDAFRKPLPSQKLTPEEKRRQIEDLLQGYIDSV